MINKKLYNKLLRIGKVIPESTEEIQEFENYYKNFKFPDVSDIIPSELVKSNFSLDSNSTIENFDFDDNSLSMAARNGKDLPKEILDKMHSDRNKAENNETE